jgi:hypothetical protein
MNGSSHNFPSPWKTGMNGENAKYSGKFFNDFNPE